MQSIEILEKLISFDTVSKNPNNDLMNYVSTLLMEHGIRSTLIPNHDQSKANLYATIGPADTGGVMLSGHTDVVPVDGQDWTMPPFKLSNQEGKLFGRGTADMKGFVACAISACIAASRKNLKTPLHLALSYDEEIGCVGVHSMIEMLAQAPIRPSMCIVGEPTNLSIATGHKGKTGLRATCIGKEGHSALAPFALNAIYLACDFVSELRNLQSEIEQNGIRDEDYDVPYSTLHVGKINGGVALNIVPNLCVLDFEIRNIAQDDPLAILEKIRQRASGIVKKARSHASQADIRIEVFNSYPGLNTPQSAPIIEFVKSLNGSNATMKVAFGTEGGLFSGKLGIPTVICGPGSMEQGHKPDEFITLEQIHKCDEMLARLVGHLEAGL